MAQSKTHRVFVTGSTGYIGNALIPVLVSAGHTVTALVRESSRGKVPPGCQPLIGNALDGDSYADAVSGHDTFIHLVGVAHPSPKKARQFIEIDLLAAKEAMRVASSAGIDHFVYLSVAQPAPVMKIYLDVRAACEQTLHETAMNGTILRPWYVLGPGHRWPYLLIPFYRIAEMIPHTREQAQRLGLVTLAQMVRAIAKAVDQPPAGVRVMDVPAISA